MRTKAIEIIVAIVLGLLIPSLLILILQDRVVVYNETTQTRQTEIANKVTINTITVISNDGTVRDLPIEEYVTAVVLNEMPANFETEALKAQAVVARTYALRRILKPGKHEEAAVCLRSSCCQGFCDIAAYMEKGGTEADVQKVVQAVDDTSGFVIVYDDELIDATYFSCSGGATEDASEVWGAVVPYLQSVQSPGEEGASHYVDTVNIQADDFLKCLDLKEQKIKIGNVTHTKGGGVESIVICDVEFSGTQLRKKLSLRSTAFYITAIGDSVTITTKGYGHRVGMSQYGADAMAVNGASYEEILQHYYQGTEVISFDID